MFSTNTKVLIIEYNTEHEYIGGIINERKCKSLHGKSH